MTDMLQPSVSGQKNRPIRHVRTSDQTYAITDLWTWRAQKTRPDLSPSSTEHEERGMRLVCCGAQGTYTCALRSTYMRAVCKGHRQPARILCSTHLHAPHSPFCSPLVRRRRRGAEPDALPGALRFCGVFSGTSAAAAFSSPTISAKPI